MCLLIAVAVLAAWLILPLPMAVVIGRIARARDEGIDND